MTTPTDDHRARLYAVWASMKQRCNNPRSPLFKWYGAKGIRVCDPWNWANGFQFFHQWALANGYAPGLTIDRHPDRAGHYSPENCRWVTRAENLRNRTMTPAWRAALDKARNDPKARIMTERKLLALRANVAKARQSPLLRRMTPKRLESMMRNLEAAHAARRNPAILTTQTNPPAEPAALGGYGTAPK